MVALSARMPARSINRTSMPAHKAFSVCHVLDDQGRETQITETMIMNACEALRRRCHRPNKSI